MGSGGPVVNEARASGIFRSFIFMATCFSINHGTVTAVLGIASAEFGTSLASMSSGTLYLVYTFSALLVAPTLVASVGSKRALVIGLGLYCAYVGSFLAALLTGPPLRGVCAIIGATIGGFGGGLIWTAQGEYFTYAALAYASAKGIETSQANATFSGVFATFYLGFEVTMKLLSSLLLTYTPELFNGSGVDVDVNATEPTAVPTPAPTVDGFDSWAPTLSAGPTAFPTMAPTSTPQDAKVMVFLVFTVLAVASAFAMTLAPTMAAPPSNKSDASPEEEGHPSSSATTTAPSAFDKVTVALRLLRDDPKCRLLAPFNIAFGFVSSFVTLYVNGTTVSDSLGSENVGYLTSILVGAATLASVPLAEMNKATGGPASVIVLGGSCWALFALCFLISPLRAQLTTWATLVPLYIVYGMGRATWEGQFKAVWADFFPNDSKAAFANVIMQSGLSSSIGFFAFGHLSAGTCGALALFFIVFGVVSYFWARAIHKREQAARLIGDYHAVN